MCDAGYVDFTRRHLHQSIEEHKNVLSFIGKHFRVEHSLDPKDLNKNFKILKKCKNKFDCLIYEMFFIHELRPSLSLTDKHFLKLGSFGNLKSSFCLRKFSLTIGSSSEIFGKLHQPIQKNPNSTKCSLTGMIVWKLYASGYRLWPRY